MENNPENKDPDNSSLKFKCDYCGGSGVIQEKNSFYSCPHCYLQHRFIEVIEVAIANLVLDKKEDEAEELNIIYELLYDCPLLAVLEAEYQGRSKKFINRIKSTFNVKPLY